MDPKINWALEQAFNLKLDFSETGDDFVVLRLMLRKCFKESYILQPGYGLLNIKPEAPLQKLH
ncbi:hypothetical protein RchiOBHm_Chr6g0283011 [Rosa chinensis]|uniref:Uncharacterized protein n=1 Tax=Rosa chinensis TaxID=74649 RepID=A0A2P6PTY6_ROSCH|nr:hypothetical protein RchiOBHm_Chr6g0283011 [Rosa chinensis]